MGLPFSDVWAFLEQDGWIWAVICHYKKKKITKTNSSLSEKKWQGVDVKEKVA